MYQGEFKDDKQHGQGTFIWKNGAKRVGEFRKGKLFNITEFGKNGKMLKKWGQVDNFGVVWPFSNKSHKNRPNN